MWGEWLLKVDVSVSDLICAVLSEAKSKLGTNGRVRLLMRESVTLDTSGSSFSILPPLYMLKIQSKTVGMLMSSTTYYLKFLRNHDSFSLRKNCQPIRLSDSPWNKEFGR